MNLKSISIVYLFTIIFNGVSITALATGSNSSSNLPECQSPGEYRMKPFQQTYEVGFQCETPTKETFYYGSYSDQKVTWTIVALLDEGPVWSAETRWGQLVIPPVYPFELLFEDAKSYCESLDYSVKIHKKSYKVKFKIPIKFPENNRNSSENLTNFNLAEFLNYLKVVPSIHRGTYWSPTSLDYKTTKGDQSKSYPYCMGFIESIYLN